MEVRRDRGRGACTLESVDGGSWGDVYTVVIVVNNQMELETVPFSVPTLREVLGK